MATFAENFREATKGLPFVKISKNVDESDSGFKWTNMFPEKFTYSLPNQRNEYLVEKAGYDKKTNPLIFREAEENEDTGRQKITLINKNGDKEDIFLVVPQKEVVGYGNIVGWGSPDSQNWNTLKGMTSEGNPKFPLLTAPLSFGADLVMGNSINNNSKKQSLSKYTGEDKAVGLGEENESEGQILGMIDSNGVEYSAKKTKNFLENLSSNGYIGIEDIEKPERKQEHYGPDYVPGDILLGLLGLRPNRGAVAYKFKAPDDNVQYRDFIRNLRMNNK